ncbi:MAG: glycosyltransferase [Sporocytophaga sp.]|uniref:glycosyltransferase n=1 Tax=Sporocytophaga sp. TaxID=2231183 RepID=UPI001B24AE39|nr:glycosyltransferase [Sporocytophaga sp.]MBO9699682.1 glycosyltransferase [Sporocytophaga sp.]
MKLSFIIPSFYPATSFGGTIFYSLDLCKSIAAKGIEVHVSTTNTNMKGYLEVDTKQSIELDNGMFVRYYHDTLLNRFSLPLFFNIKRDIERSDVVHINAIFNSSTAVALFWANRLNKKIILSPHGVLGDWILNQGLPFKRVWLNTFIKPYANKVIWHATAEQERKEILSHYPKAKIEVIPAGIYVNEYSKALSISKEAFLEKVVGKKIIADKIIIGMSRMHKKKGFDILIKAFKKLSEQSSQKLLLLIAGEDEGEKGNLKNLIKALDLKDEVFLLPALYEEDKIKFLQVGDLFVLPSYNENFGIVVAEALASGTPVITSIYTPWQGIVNHNCGDWISNTEPELICAMSKLLNTENDSLKLNAKKFAAQFDWENIANKMIEIYK